MNDALILSLAACCLVATGPAAAQDEPSVPVNRIVATVGNDVILQSDVEIQYLQALAQGVEQHDDLRCRILEDLLFRKLLKTQAKIDSVTVNEAQVDAELDRRVDYFVRQIGSKEKLEEYYGKSILEVKDEFREMISDQLIEQTMQSKITGGVKVSPSEVREFYRGIPADSLPYVGSEVELAQIVRLPEVSAEARLELTGRLEGYRKRIVEGSTSLAALAAVYSEDPSYKKRGEIGFVSRGDLVPEFEAIAFRLTPISDVEAMIDSVTGVRVHLEKLGGENLEARLALADAALDSLRQLRCSGVVESPYGYHLVQLIERRGDQINVRHILLRPKLSDEVKRMTLLFLDSVRALVMNGRMTFSEAVGKFSQDEDSRLFEGNIVNEASGTTRFEMSELDPLLSFTINSLSVGSVSEPAAMQTKDGKEAYRIVLLRSRSEPHVMNLKDDYKRVQDMALMKKQTDMIASWIRKKKNNMYIHIVDEYRGCAFTNDWVN